MPVLKSRRLTGFTLLELIVVLLVLGILAAIAVPTFQTVKENSAERAAQSTLEAIDRNGEAIAISDPDLSDVQVATTAVAETTAPDGMTITRDGAEITVENVSGSITASGTVTFSGGVGTIVDATVSGGGSSSSGTWSMTAVAWPGWTSGGAYSVSNVSYNSTTKVLSFDTSFDCHDVETFAANSKDLYIRDEARSQTFSYSVPEGTWSNSTGSWVFDPSTGGTDYTREGGAVVATRSSAGNEPCSFTVDFGAFMTDTGLTSADATDARVQQIYIAMGNGSGTPNGYRLLLS